MTAILISLIASTLIGCNDPDVQNLEPVIDSLVVSQCDNLFPPIDTLIASHTSFTREHYPKRIEKFKEDTIKSGDIVMLGNSLTEQGGNWEVRLGELEVKNRGIAGDNTDGVLARLNEILCNKPSIVLIMIGTNDLFTSYSPDKIAENMDLIANTLAEELPDTRVVLQTIMPLAAGNDKKTKLMAINDALMNFEKPLYELVDTNSEMSNDSGDLIPEYTTDGVHLTPAGYGKWSTFLKSIIARGK